LSNGWSEVDIRSAYSYLTAQVQAGPQAIQKNQQVENTVSKFNKKTAIIIAVVLLNIMALGGGIFAFSKFSAKKEPKPKKTVENAAEKQEQKAKVEAQMVDCGAIGPENSDATAKVSECIEPKFQDCAPAKMNLSIDMSLLGAGIVTYAYEIVGPDVTGCRVKTKFLKNPNPELIEKEMVCTLDNSRRFEDASMETMTEKHKCSGPLWDAMHKQGG